MWQLSILFMVSFLSSYSKLEGLNQEPLILYPHASPDESKLSRQLLITGCSRSGTTYIAHVLIANGLQVTHEADGTYGIVSWPMCANTTLAPWGPGFKKYQFAHIFHQVRHPLKTIASASHELKKSWKFICEQCPAIHLNEPAIVKAAKYWYYWNLMAERKAELTYRIEDMEKILPEMSRRLGVPLDPQVLLSIPKNTNTWHSTTTYTWKELQGALSPALYRRVYLLAKRYGYSTED